MKILNNIMMCWAYHKLYMRQRDPGAKPHLTENWETTGELGFLFVCFSEFEFFNIKGLFSINSLIKVMGMKEENFGAKQRWPGILKLTDLFISTSNIFLHYPFCSIIWSIYLFTLVMLSNM